MAHFIALQPTGYGGYASLGRPRSDEDRVNKGVYNQGWTFRSFSFANKRVYYQGRNYEIIRQIKKQIPIQQPLSLIQYAKKCLLGMVSLIYSIWNCHLPNLTELFSRYEVVYQEDIAFICKFTPPICQEKGSVISTRELIPETTSLPEEDLSCEIIPKESISKVQDLMPSILNKSCKGDEIFFFRCRESNRVFSLKPYPNWVFKLNASPDHLDGSTKSRWKNRMKAFKLIEKHKFQHVILPRAERFIVLHKGKAYTVIVEERLNCQTDIAFQEKAYKQAGDKAIPAIKEFAHLICNKVLSDVEYRNNPLVGDKIALFDFEVDGRGYRSVSDVLLGEQGRRNRRGLLNCCITFNQAKAIKEVAEIHKVSLYGFEAAWIARKKELEIDTFYRKKML